MLLKQSPLYPLHRQSGARMVEFAGWEVPVQFTSILEEHRAVRASAGLFDVSHLGRLWVRGQQASELLQLALTNDLARVPVGAAQYTLLCREDGGIVDDLVVFHTGEGEYLLAVNAANTDRDLSWLQGLAAGLQVEMSNATPETVMLALQGPQAQEFLSRIAPPGLAHLPRFGCQRELLLGNSVLVSRTGYTGEDGYELIIGPPLGEAMWRGIMGLGVKACGLGARDTLRLEAALPLYGNDIDTATNALEAGLGWAVAWGKGDFVGREALWRVKEAGPHRRLTCFRMVERGVPRSGFPILKEGREVGRVTSGNYSPTLGINIGMGYVPLELSQVGAEFDVLIRDKPVRAQVVPRPFYKRA